VRTFGGEVPRVPGAAIKNTCLTVYIVLLGFFLPDLRINLAPQMGLSLFGCGTR